MGDLTRGGSPAAAASSQVLADHENNAVRITNREIAHVIRPIYRFDNHLGPSLDDFSMVRTRKGISIDIPNPGYAVASLMVL